MLKRLTRKLFILFVLGAALTAVAAVPSRARAEPTCWVCYCDDTGCYCQQVVCPE